MFTNALLYAALLPLAVAASVAFIMRRMRCLPPVIWPVATTAGFLVSQFALRSQSGLSEGLQAFLRPHEPVDWLPHIVLLALGVSVVMYLAPAHRERLFALAAAICLAVPVRLLSGNVAYRWSTLEKFAWLTVLAGVLGIVWRLVASSEGEHPAALRVSLVVLVTVGTAIVLTQSGVFVFGLSCGALGAAITGTALVSSPGAAASKSGVAATGGVLTFVLGSLIILSRFFAELSTTNAALLLLSLAATAAPLPGFLSSRPPWQRNTIRFLYCFLPLAIAVVSVVA